MSDDLVKRLRETTHMYQADCELKMKCADRIEELEAKLEGKAQDLTECAVCVYELEAKLAKAVEAFREITDDEYCQAANDLSDHYNPNGLDPKLTVISRTSAEIAVRVLDKVYEVRTTLAELKGQDDE